MINKPKRGERAKKSAEKKVLKEKRGRKKKNKLASDKLESKFKKKGRPSNKGTFK